MNRPQYNLVCDKSFLRVRGIEDVAKEIAYYQNLLDQLNLEASVFFEECKNKNFVLKIHKINKAVQYAVKGLYKIYIPMMVFVYYENGKRKDVFDWKEVEQKLEQSNATLDEYVEHMKIWIAFKDYYYRGRQISSSLKCLYRLQKDFKQLPKYD